MQSAERADHAVDMTRGNIYSLIVRFAIPVFLGELFQQLYNTADAFIVGRVLGTNGLAAVTSSGSLIFLMTSFFIGTFLGGGVVISRYFGAKDMTRVSQSIHTLLAFGIVSGVFLTAFGVVMTPHFLRWMKTDPEVLPQAIEYFRWYFYGAFAMVMYNVCRSIMNALGDSRRPLYYLIVSSVTNIVLDWLFLAVFHWGVWSAAFATVLSQAASVVLSLIRLLKKKNGYEIRIRDIRFHKVMLSEIIRFGLPSGVQNSVIAIANVVLQTEINTFGKLAMAAFGVHSKIQGFAFLPITSFNMGCTTFISQNLGAKEYERAKKGARFSLFAGMIIAELIGAATYLFASDLIGFFDPTPGVVELGMKQCRIEALFYFVLALSHGMAAILRGAGKAVVPMAVMLSVWCVFRIIYILIVMRIFGNITYVYAAYPITWVISSLIFVIYYKRSDWIHGFGE